MGSKVDIFGRTTKENFQILNNFKFLEARGKETEESREHLSLYYIMYSKKVISLLSTLNSKLSPPPLKKMKKTAFSSSVTKKVCIFGGRN